MLAQTASELQLHYRNPEQLRLDAVFSNQDLWFPIVIAIEHENAGGGFASEVMKLLSVRCRLKVGMTYPWSWCERRQKKLTDIERTIKEYCREISENIGEDPRTEYLFLVGTEVREREKVIEWYALHFRAGDGCDGATFDLADAH